MVTTKLAIQSLSALGSFSFWRIQIIPFALHQFYVSAYQIRVSVDFVMNTNWRYFLPKYISNKFFWWTMYIQLLPATTTTNYLWQNRGIMQLWIWYFVGFRFKNCNKSKSWIIFNKQIFIACYSECKGSQLHLPILFRGKTIKNLVATMFSLPFFPMACLFVCSCKSV